MITFTAHASGSGGNLYRITDGSSSLLLECGIHVKKIMRAMGHNLHSFEGCLLTHEHQDHAKAAQNLINYSVDLYCSRGTAEALGLTGHRVHIVRALEQFKVGPWTILPFEAQHDAAEPLGFLIQNGTEKLLWCMDSYFIKHRFQGLTMIAVECNYSERTLSGDIPPAQKHRLLRSHLSLETFLDFLAANDLSGVREIHLLHLSSDNSDEELFKDIIQANTGIPVYVAAR